MGSCFENIHQHYADRPKKSHDLNCSQEDKGEHEGEKEA